MKEQLRYWTERIALFSDQSAYEKLFFHLYDFLFACAYAILKNRETSEEVVLDTFVNLWRNRMRLPEIHNIQVYLYVSVKNLSLKSAAHDNRRREISWDDFVGEDEAVATPSPEELLISNETVRQIEHAIESLPPKCKVIFKMVREDGLKYKEIARILDISVKTIDAQMAIATKKITESIGFLQNQ
ncbi:RNA polymerase sigma-70 factor [Dyadobacter sp. MSC1_007]|jgi:RNA polymerase sigma-70 factor (family 1)|uniref:RNA polymerase sigma-70 factor n=1 Tax=Dyadobacter sp. MSC1_007 TaxID=2909264 RepID=UPI00202FE39E|nr:RNA polymerase sigma-70 factor [Dyadobacter sp. MSC1_007]